MIEVWGITDIGLVRRENQDAYAVRQENGHTVCVVCDGMGGVAGGKLASSIAVETFTEELWKVLREDQTPQQLREASSYAVSLANAAICKTASEHAEYSSMGTTLVSAAACGEGDSVILTNVGDSRAYHITEGGIRRVTKDHSLVERMVERGDITAEEARRHPSRNLITRALGPDSDAQCDTYVCPLAAGEYILLCTDGLTGTVTDQEILFEVIHGGGADTCLTRLLEIAKDQGAPDNVTAVLMRKL